MKKDLGVKNLIFPTPVLVVGTYDAQGKPNVMTAAWGGVCCSSPLCVAISLRKATYTYKSLMETEAFTINIPGLKHVKEADYFGIASGENEDKFAKTGFTAVKSELVNAPYVEELPVNMECKVILVNELGLHTQFVGEVVNTKISDELQDGKPLIEQIMPLIYALDSRTYYSISENIGGAFSIGKEI